MESKRQDIVIGTILCFPAVTLAMDFMGRALPRAGAKASALQDTLRGGSVGLETHIDVQSSEPAEKIRHLVKMGEQTCFTLQSLIDPVPVKTSVTVNGEPLALSQ